MVEERRFTYELDLIAENVTSATMQDVVPGGPAEVLQIEGTVAAEDRSAMKATHSMGVDRDRPRRFRPVPEVDRPGRSRLVVARGLRDAWTALAL